MDQARVIARRLAAAGKPVSRRALRSGGVTGSNEALNALARMINAELAGCADGGRKTGTGEQPVTMEQAADLADCRPGSDVQRIERVALGKAVSAETQVLSCDWKRQLRAWSLDACSTVSRRSVGQRSSASGGLLAFRHG